jgi:hypothetical protein
MKHIQEVTLSGVATKQDIDDLKQDIHAFKATTKQDIHDLRMSTKTEIAHQKIWFLGAMLTQTIALVAVILSV